MDWLASTHYSGFHKRWSYFFYLLAEWISFDPKKQTEWTSYCLRDKEESFESLGIFECWKANIPVVTINHNVRGHPPCWLGPTHMWSQMDPPTDANSGKSREVKDMRCKCRWYLNLFKICFTRGDGWTNHLCIFHRNFFIFFLVTFQKHISWNFKEFNLSETNRRIML